MRKTIERLKMSTALAACVVGTAVVNITAYAQGPTLDEIVVTATKRETNLQDTPVAISAFTGEALNKAGVADLQDIDTFTPGLFIGGNASFGSNGIGIRGIGSTLIGIGGDEAVGIYVDGVFQGRNTGAIFEFADVERVEVLRGPQGTLYGRNATGGAINVVTIQPGNEFRASVQGEVTNYDGYATRGYVVTPLIDGVLSAKLSAGISGRDGFQDNIFTDQSFGDVERQYFSGALRWTPDERTDITFRGYTGSTNLPLNFTNLEQPLPLDPEEEVSVDFRSEEERSFTGFNLNGTYDLGPAEIAVVLGYVESDVVGFTDSDGTEVDNVQFRDFEEAEQYSAEVRLTSTGDGPVSWITGFYFFNEEAEASVPFNAFRTVIPGFEAATAAPLGILFEADIETTSFAGFGEVSYAATDKLTMTAGVRYTDESKDYNGCANFAAFTLFEVDFDPSACGGLSVPDSLDADVLTPRFVVDYAFSDDVLGYVSATRGFRSGGFTFTDPTFPGGGNGFDPEFVWSYELGLKTTLADNRVRLNLASFYQDYTDLQVRVTDPETSLLSTQNAGTAEIFGVEAEFDAAVTDRFNLFGTLAWLDATYDEFSFVQDGTLVDFSGNRLNRAPEWTSSLGAEYAAPIGNFGQLVPRVEWQYVSEIFHNEQNAQPFGSDAFHLVNVRVRLEPNDQNWSIEGFVENVASEQYREHTFLGILPTIVPATISPPAIYGARFTATF
ncbi:MAG: TonB-dependent receptor [Pseudomonadota bacterium]